MLKPRLLEGVYLLDKKSMRSRSLMIHNNFSNRMALCWRWFIQISALSTFDGRIVVACSEAGGSGLGENMARNVTYKRYTGDTRRKKEGSGVWEATRVPARNLR